MINWIKKITGIEAAEKAALKRQEEEKLLADLEFAKEQAEAELRKIKEQEELAKLSPKERATKQGESWVAVLDVKFNENNIRNGFFELDWNEFFIKELIANGYGTEADPPEEIVDRWFRTIVYDMFSEEGLDTQRGAGYINVVPISKGKSEVS